MLRFTENNEVIRDDAYRAILVGLQTSEDISYSMEELKGLGFRVLPSKANFVFAASDRMRGERFFNELRKYDIIVRHFKDEKIADYVRITIGTSEEMELLISATRKILESI